MPKYCFLCVIRFCGFFRDPTHSLSPYWGLFPVPFLMYHLTVFPLGSYLYNFLLMGSSFFCWSCQVQSEKTTWPIKNLVPWKFRPLLCHCEQHQPAFCLRFLQVKVKQKCLSSVDTKIHMWDSPISSCFSGNTGKKPIIFFCSAARLQPGSRKPVSPLVRFNWGLFAWFDHGNNSTLYSHEFS